MSLFLREFAATHIIFLSSIDKSFTPASIALSFHFFPRYSHSSSFNSSLLLTHCNVCLNAISSCFKCSFIGNPLLRYKYETDNMNVAVKCKQKE
jgi:hypothetical protein